MNYVEDDDDGVIISRHLTRTPSTFTNATTDSERDGTSGASSPRFDKSRDTRKTVALSNPTSRDAITRDKQRLSFTFGGKPRDASGPSGISAQLTTPNSSMHDMPSPGSALLDDAASGVNGERSFGIANSYESSNTDSDGDDGINENGMGSNDGEDDGTKKAGGLDKETLEFDLEADEDEENIVFNVTKARNTFIESTTPAKKGAYRETLFRGSLLKGIVYIAKGRPSSFNHTKRCWCILDRDKFQLRCYDMNMRASFEIDLRLSEMPQIDDEVRHGDATFYPFVISSPYTGKAFTLELDSKELRDRWLDSVAHVIEYMDPPDETLLRLFIDSDTDGSYTLGLNEIKKLLRDRQIQMHPAVIEEKFKEVDIDGSDEMNYSEFEAFESLIQFDDQTAKVFRENVSKSISDMDNGDMTDISEIHMHLADFTRFLRKTQGESYSEDEVLALLDAYRPKTRCPPSSFDVTGFTNFLVNPISNSALVMQPRTESYYSHPLSHYFICSAANPALAPDPKAALTLAIESNCRYFELSLIEKDGAPVFGLKNTPTLEIRETLTAIGTLFKRDSGLPVILYLYVGCEVPLQFDFLNILFEIFGERISVMQTTDALYSPAYLGGRVLLSKKPVVKIDGFDDFDDDEDEDGTSEISSLVTKAAATSISENNAFSMLLDDTKDSKHKKKGDKKGDKKDDDSKDPSKSLSKSDAGAGGDLKQTKHQASGSILKSSSTKAKQQKPDYPIQNCGYSFPTAEPGLTYVVQPDSATFFLTSGGSGSSGSINISSNGGGDDNTNNANISSSGGAATPGGDNNAGGGSISMGMAIGMTMSLTESGDSDDGKGGHMKKRSFSTKKSRLHKLRTKESLEDGTDLVVAKDDEDDPTTSTSPYDLIAPLHKCAAFRAATFAGVVRRGPSDRGFMLNTRDSADYILQVKANVTEYFNFYRNIGIFREYLLTHLARTFHYKSLKPLQRMVSGSQITPTNFGSSPKSGITPFLMSYRGFMQIQGMTLKPDWMLKSRPIPPAENAIYLHVKIINARQLPTLPRVDLVSPFCTAEICGFDAESSPSYNKYMTYDGETRVPKVFNMSSQIPPNAPQSTQVVNNNGWDPAWNKKFKFVLFAPELDVLLITIHHKSYLGGSQPICYASVPCKLLKKGYRPLTLYNRDGKELPSSHLLCFFKFVPILKSTKQDDFKQYMSPPPQPSLQDPPMKDDKKKTRKKREKGGKKDRANVSDSDSDSDDDDGKKEIKRKKDRKESEDAKKRKTKKDDAEDDGGDDGDRKKKDKRQSTKKVTTAK